MFRKIMAMAVLMSFCAMAQDVFMGDYKGTLKDAEGKESALCAQVWATGKGGYQAVFTETIYEAPKPKVLLKVDGKVDGDKVVFNDGGATIANGVFKGAIPLGAIDLKTFKLVSPTLGLQPPEGAVVLMGPGKRMSQWRNAERAAGIVDLNRRLARANNCVGYLSNTIVSDKEQNVIMRSGSDDGLVVFLNGQKVYEKNVPRSLATDEDTIKLNLKQGENALLLKVSQGGGDWQAHARICGADGNAVPGISYKLHPQGLAMDKKGAIMAWNIAGPFTVQGKDGFAAMNEAFAPEKGEAVEWKLVEDRRMGGERWGVSEDGGTLEVRRGGGSIVSGPEYGSCIMHVEFKTSYMPEARGQGRCNSGVYTQGRIEMQILDSYALEGRDNECGGIYQQSRPIVNMCLPPETWQTYDIDYTAAKFDAEGKVIEDAILTVRQNGVLIHDHLRVKPTPGGLGGNAVAKGPLMLQDHGNTLWFRNLWFKEK